MMMMSGDRCERRIPANLGVVQGTLGFTSDASDSFRLALKLNRANQRVQYGLVLAKQALAEAIDAAGDVG